MTPHPHPDGPSPAAPGTAVLTAPAGPAHCTPPRHGGHWFDSAAGPLVRPYAVTDGRTRPDPGTPALDLDLLSQVTVDSRTRDGAGPDRLGPEHRTLLDLCRSRHRSVAELAAASGLPLSVVRVLLGDLLALDCLRVSPPSPPGHLPDQDILREVIDGLRAL
ncbi:DUF742 domain-containing protein [Streptomyces sp. NPDC002055]|uniref:DUF742 domain-containing protein n=1 Tax=Streptomyces sp. NPDC002055 TaxID=3154534 RepID=UPI00331CA4A0